MRLIPDPTDSPAPGVGPFLRRALIVVGLGVGLLLAWTLREVALLLFAAAVVALMLRSLSHPVAQRTRLNDGWALGVVVLGLVVVALLIGGFFGWRLQGQITEAANLLPPALKLFVAWVRGNPLGSRVISDLNQLHFGAAVPTLMELPRYALSAVAIVGDLLLIVAGGVYLAAQPEVYRDGVLRLLPARLREHGALLMDESGALLRKWLLAQLIAMATVGVMVGVGMWIIGAPDPAALGLLAGLAEFVPIIGPVVSAVPALLLALLHGVDKAEWTLVLFVVIQQIEGNLLLPLLQKRIMRLPPVLTLFALVSFGIVLGPLGVILATPLTIVGVVLVSRLYLKTPPPRDGDAPADGEPVEEELRRP